MTLDTNSSRSLHTPESLLYNAEELLKLDTPAARRAAILEAIVALESYVQLTVFPYLTRKLGHVFSDWLEQKTRMDFDARLSVLAPYAMGITVETQSTLWNEYKVARKIRHAVVHQGRKVSYIEARSVIDIASKWIAHIGFTIELELRLTALKEYVEKNKVAIKNSQEAKAIILDWFQEAQVTSFIGASEGLQREYLRLCFGKNSILLHCGVKEREGLHLITRSIMDLMNIELESSRDVRGVWIDFLHFSQLLAPEAPVQRLYNDKIYYIVITCTQP